MPRIKVNFSVKARAGDFPVEFHLDTEQTTQKVMLEFFQAQRFYEAETCELLGTLLEPGDTFIDAGGHVGFYSIIAAALVGSTGRVFTFEPERANYERLLFHIGVNKLQHVVPYPWALGSDTRIVELFINQDNDGGHALWNPGLYPLAVKGRTTVVKVPTYLTTLDAVLNHHDVGKVKLLKIDVEGNEFGVLQGAREFIVKTKLPAIVLEINHFGLAQQRTSEDQIRAFLTGMQYVTYLLRTWPPEKMTEHQHYNSQFVHNLLFVNPELHAAMSDKWPQTFTQ